MLTYEIFASMLAKTQRPMQNRAIEPWIGQKNGSKLLCVEPRCGCGEANQAPERGKNPLASERPHCAPLPILEHALQFGEARCADREAFDFLRIVIAAAKNVVQ